MDEGREEVGEEDDDGSEHCAGVWDVEVLELASSSNVSQHCESLDMSKTPFMGVFCRILTERLINHVNRGA